MPRRLIGTKKRIVTHFSIEDRILKEMSDKLAKEIDNEILKNLCEHCDYVPEEEVRTVSKDPRHPCIQGKPNQKYTIKHTCSSGAPTKYMRRASYGKRL